jgi:integrase
MQQQTNRRERIERGIYKRTTADDETRLEIGYRDADGRQRWRAVDGGIKAARAALAIELAKRARGERIASDPRETFRTAADAWWEARAVKLRPTTQSAYSANLKHLRRYFDRQRMTQITPTDVARYVSKKQAEGLRGETIKGHLTVLSSVFTYAARHRGLNAQNPVRLLDRVERPHREDKRPKRILNADELLELLAGVSKRHRILFETAAQTGCRLGEVLGLAWEDVHLEENTIEITHQLDRKGNRVPLKTKRSRRALEVTPELAAQLREHKLRSRFSAPHELVFTTAGGSGHDHRNIGGRALARAVERAELGAVKDRDGVIVQPAPTFHDLRHSHASALIAQGWDIEEVSARLGHASVATTQEIYVHAFDAARRSDDRRARLASLYGPDPVVTDPPLPKREVGHGSAHGSGRGAARRGRRLAVAAETPDLRRARGTAR